MEIEFGYSSFFPVTPKKTVHIKKKNAKRESGALPAQLCLVRQLQKRLAIKNRIDKKTFCSNF